MNQKKKKLLQWIKKPGCYGVYKRNFGFKDKIAQSNSMKNIHHANSNHKLKAQNGYTDVRQVGLEIN